MKDPLKQSTFKASSSTMIEVKMAVNENLKLAKMTFSLKDRQTVSEEATRELCLEV